ncbi:helix-turn-helix domain-containing protein, partial [Patescibacteria group bacterium]|nr:helix-turn-helix domain-containing protein [Patescibacteria group bacterium]
MAKKIERQRAIKLRKQGKSYSQIKKIIKVNKSTLSYWLKDYPLSKQRIKELRDWNEQRIEKFRQTMRQKREKRWDDALKKAEKELLPLSKKELLIAGFFLYWGEGTKRMKEGLSISNTDPEVIKFTIFWMTKILNIPKSKIKAGLHLYKDMNIREEHNFWVKETGIPLKQFRKPYIKKTSTNTINYAGFKHGTCGIFGGSVRLKEMVIMSIKAVSE